jgi:hypothetical protein
LPRQLIGLESILKFHGGEQQQWQTTFDPKLKSNDTHKKKMIKIKIETKRNYILYILGNTH